MGRTLAWGWVLVLERPQVVALCPPVTGCLHLLHLPPLLFMHLFPCSWLFSIVSLTRVPLNVSANGRAQGVAHYTIGLPHGLACQ